ncbi:PREDICTED: uncharacterized protein LOC107073618 [Polistes dominula]|uniref:Uncharacterized protein LOC107073618 n=1 Tax=Polistes dominula TaxID=743375 RepID=A0ABM1JBF9_POLDO|nr:PREDICTED: uncharacterized protein LOC107073618 [Polistes dominula]
MIKVVPDNELNNRAHYLPHRYVIKSGSITPLRPVFDASASEKGFPSLNQCLEKGPNLIELIPEILLKFREDNIAVIADIRKAFLQIEINPKDRDYLRFLWFVKGKIKALRHRRVSFGLTSSPFLLGAVLEYRISRIKEVPKYITEKLSKSFYVNNCVTSVKSPVELETFVELATSIMKKGGFELQGWEYTHDNSEKEETRVLGILFNKARDTISIKTVLVKEISDEITKRKILSTAHKIFDPIGFTAPVVIIPRLILKRLCKSGHDWDSPTDEKSHKELFTWYNQLHYLNRIELPRSFGEGVFSLHTFCDASQSAYAAVTFLRVENENEVKLHFLAAKARIAPDNSTIPRLELLAACIGNRRTEDVLQAISCKDIPVFCWSDSTTVLTWINRDSQWGSWTWQYVPGPQNPVDLPSRGCQAKQLYDSRWWEGPDWLYGSRNTWPCAKGVVDESEINSELKKSAKLTMLNVKCVDVNLKDIRTKYLTYKKIHETKIKLLKCLQHDMFLLKNDPKLSAIKVFKHTDGLLRLKTKIIQRNDNFSFLCPILLDSRHKVVELLVRETHESMNHAGVQTVMCQLREKYWILRMRKTVREIISKCVICKRQGAKPMRKAWICLFTCAVYRAVHLELVTAMSTAAFLDALDKFITRRGRLSVIYSDCLGFLMPNRNSRQLSLHADSP